MNAVATLSARIRRIEARRARAAVEDPRDHRWYDETCPHGLPPGECQEHPRARAAQRPPAGPWATWLVLAGRGFGKTRTGAEWVRNEVERHGARRVALVAPTAADARDVMVEGESGILACSPPGFRPSYEPSKRKLTWPNGAVAQTFSAEEPERLRGPNFDRAWIDEIGVWRKPAALDMLKFGLRLGDNPRICATTTPRATGLIRKMLAEPSTVRTGGSTLENRRHLSTEFVTEILARYEGTRLGRQEIYAEMLEVVEGAWFPGFDPTRHVSADAEWQPGLPVRLAIDCGTSRFTGAIFYQTREVEPYKTAVTVFGDFLSEGAYSEANALAIKDRAVGLCRGQVDLVRLDPAATARTGVGPAAVGEYQRVFGARIVAFWPMHLVLDGLDQIELLLDHGDLKIHPRCVSLISAFNNYSRASRGGEWLNFPDDSHPDSDMMDALRGGIRDAMPQGRAPRPDFRWTAAKNVFF